MLFPAPLGPSSQRSAPHPVRVDLQASYSVAVHLASIHRSRGSKVSSYLIELPIRSASSRLNWPMAAYTTPPFLQIMMFTGPESPLYLPAVLRRRRDAFDGYHLSRTFNIGYEEGVLQSSTERIWRFNAVRENGMPSTASLTAAGLALPGTSKLRTLGPAARGRSRSRRTEHRSTPGLSR